MLKGKVEAKPCPKTQCGCCSIEVARNARCSVCSWARDMNVSQTSMRTSLVAFGLKSFGMIVKHDIVLGLKGKERSADFRERAAKMCTNSRLLVRLFYVQQHCNWRNSRALLSVGSKDPSEHIVLRQKNPSSVKFFGP